MGVGGWEGWEGFVARLLTAHLCGALRRTEGGKRSDASHAIIVPGPSGLRTRRGDVVVDLPLVPGGGSRDSQFWRAATTAQSAIAVASVSPERMTCKLA